MKILHLINSIGDGGAETQVKNYVLNLDETKFKCAILSENIDLSSANADILLRSSVPIYSPFVPKMNIFCKIIQRIQRLLIPKNRRTAYMNWYIQHFIRFYKPDIIHAHLQMLRYLLPLTDRLMGVKIFYRCASEPSRFFNYDTELASMEYDAAKYLIKNNGLQMIALHSEMRDALNALFGIKNTLIIHNIIDLKKFQPSSSVDKNEIRQQLGIPFDAFVIGHNGRIDVVKNHQFLIDVFDYVAKVNPKAYLMMIGYGDFTDVIAKIDAYGLSKRYLRLKGRKDVNDLLKAMDVFVFPSLFEGMPNALIEAQAAGLKCIASSGITNEAIISSKTIQMDLKAGAKAWADKIIADEFEGTPQSDIQSFEISNVLKQVENLYLS